MTDKDTKGKILKIAHELFSQRAMMAYLCVKFQVLRG